MATSRARSSDIKLLAGATVAVLLVGFFVAGALLMMTRGGGTKVCGEYNVGDAAELRKTLDNGGPTFQTGGANCSFFLAIEDGEIVAYKVKQPDCTLRLKRDHWECGGRTVAAADLDRYKVSIRSHDNIDSVYVYLPPESSDGGGTSSTTRA